MTKRATHIATLRTPKPDSEAEYIQWLENRVEALTRLRLLDMGYAVDSVIAKREQHTLQLQRIESRYNSELDKAHGQIQELSKSKQKKPHSKIGYVYLLKVINEDNLYKIGRTKKPENRIRTFGVKLPFQVEYEHLIHTNNMYLLERRLHRKFSKYRVNGEFFTLTQEHVDYIKQVKGIDDIHIERVIPNWGTNASADGGE